MTIFQLAAKFGIHKGEMDDILFEIKVNNAQLDHCDKPHDFSICIDRKTKRPVSDPKPIDVLVANGNVPNVAVGFSQPISIGT